ncbi:hypothetical protein HKX42_09945 [Salinisphaera sp. USBA-960]|uniref:ATP synthase subunit I n=1 Tax=Salinisphaera orenii TaxID=856731 RepID=UPI000DBE3118|nr:hypothetical protein [Salifodinibacter halophilus]NNC27194.1 hypothetical protein [Salifodinibacter halophilus]
MQNVLIRVLLIQIVAACVCSAAFLIAINGWAAGSAAYGGGVSVLTSLLLGWRMNQAARPGADLRALYIGAAERMGVAIAAFGVGIALFDLTPLAVIVGFASAQLVYYASAGPLRQFVMTGAAEGRKGE